MQSKTPTSFPKSVWPLSLSLATTHKISFDFSSLPYLDVSVQAVSPRSYVFTTQCMEFSHADCSIRKSRGQSLLTTNPSLSQLTTSFIGSQCQGIHPALLKVSPFNQCPYMSSHCFENCSKNFTPDSFKTCR